MTLAAQRKYTLYMIKRDHLNQSLLQKNVGVLGTVSLSNYFNDIFLDSEKQSAISSFYFVSSAYHCTLNLVTVKLIT